MPSITTDTIKTLSEIRADNSVSLFVPTERSGPETEQSRIRLKNLLTAVNDVLLESGMRRPEAESLLEPAASKLDRREFWQHQGDGLAVFLSPDGTWEYRLSVKVPEVGVVAPRFHLLPLLGAMSRERLLLLAISRAKVRLFELTEEGTAPRDFDGPKSLAEAVRHADREAQLQQHAVGGGSAAFHGHDPSEQEAEDLRRFLTNVARGIGHVSKEIGADVIIAAVDELASAYRTEASHRLVDQTIPGNPDDLSNSELYRRGVEMMRSRIEENRRNAARRLEEAIGQDRAAIGFEATLEAAQAGRVAELMWNERTPAFDSGAVLDLRGEIDETARAVSMLERAAVETLKHGGTTWILPSDIDGEPIGAILRY